MRNIVFGLAFFSVLLGLRTAQAKYSGGTGEPSNPYRISDYNDLYALADDTNDYNKCFVMTSDIDLDPCLPGRRTFTTAVIARDINNANVVFDGNAFTGVFDGAGHTIFNLTIDTNGAANDYLALFGSISKWGYVSNSEVNNLCLENVHITGGDESIGLGGLVGDNYRGGNISNCCSTGSIVGGDYSQHLGGLVSGNRGNISNCSSRCSVTAGAHSFALGGLSGGMEPGTIRDSYSTGAISTGFDSFAIGGLLGYSEAGNIINCYSTGTVTTGADSFSVGGLEGYVDDSNTIHNCYFLDVAGPNNGIGEALTDAEMKQQASFVNWDFNDVWAICEGTNYPRHIWSIPAADFVCPDGVNFVDYSYFAPQWLASDCNEANGYCSGRDLDESGLIDEDDLKILCSYWLDGI